MSTPEEELRELDGLIARFQCNPTGQLSRFEALRNHMEMAKDLCNQNYEWAKRSEAAVSKLREESVRDGQIILRISNSLQEANERVSKLREALDIACRDACVLCDQDVPVEKLAGGWFHNERISAELGNSWPHRCGASKIRAALAESEGAK